MKDVVLDFINKFTDNGNSKEVIDCFTRGCCYWFAHILKTRFGGSIYYNPIDVHFACRIEGTLYDITGDIPYDRNYWYYWDTYQEFDSADYNRVYRQCVLLLER